jgi:hypothetical protein
LLSEQCESALVRRQTFDVTAECELTLCERGFVKGMKNQIGSEKSEVPGRSNQCLYRKYAAARPGRAETSITLPSTQRGRIFLLEVLSGASEWVGQAQVSRFVK